MPSRASLKMPQESGSIDFSSGFVSAKVDTRPKVTERMSSLRAPLRSRMKENAARMSNCFLAVHSLHLVSGIILA